MRMTVGLGVGTIDGIMLGISVVSRFVRESDCKVDNI